MKLQEVLHLYLGCELEYILSGIKHTLIGIESDDTAYIFGGTNGRRVVSVHHVKPILRPLTSMSREEYQKYDCAQKDGEVGEEFIGSEAETSTAFVYFSHMAISINRLRKDGFDCDGLIESGLAINKSLQKV